MLTCSPAPVKQRIPAARVKAALAVNRELILMYWDIGRLIVERPEAGGRGAIEQLSVAEIFWRRSTQVLTGDLVSGAKSLTATRGDSKTSLPSPAAERRDGHRR